VGGWGPTCENQKHPCPASQGWVPFVQSQPKGMYFQCPVMGNWCVEFAIAPRQGASVESIALRVGG
jgi:hypothetical protein